MAVKAFIMTAANAWAQEHRERTIDHPVSVSEIGQHDAVVASALQELGYEEVRCWGSKPGAGNLRSWDQMEPGDRAFLYAGGGQFPLTLPVVHKARSAPLAEHFWDPDDDGGIFELMFFFGAPTELGLTTAEIRTSLGYDDKWWPQGLQYPTPEHQEALLDKFGSLTAFVATAADSQSVPPANGAGPTASELLFGGPFGGAPQQPPKAPQKRTDYDPDITGRGHLAHERTVEQLANHVGPDFRKGTPGINHDGGWAVGDQFHLAEVKSINSRNEVSQLQKGLGQILHNCFKATRHGIDVQGYLLAEREPANSPLWRELASGVGIVVSWPERFAEDLPV